MVWSREGSFLRRSGANKDISKSETEHHLAAAPEVMIRPMQAPSWPAVQPPWAVSLNHTVPPGFPVELPGAPTVGDHLHAQGDRLVDRRAEVPEAVGVRLHQQDVALRADRRDQGTPGKRYGAARPAVALRRRRPAARPRAWDRLAMAREGAAGSAGRTESPSVHHECAAAGQVYVFRRARTRAPAR